MPTLVTVPPSPYDNNADAQADAERCMKALTKEYPSYVFTVSPRAGGVEVVMVNSTVQGDKDFHSARAFAKGFMASAYLWER